MDEVLTWYHDHEDAKARLHFEEAPRLAFGMFFGSESIDDVGGDGDDDADDEEDDESDGKDKDT